MATPTDVSIEVSVDDGPAPLAVALTPHATDLDDDGTPVFTIDWGDHTPTTTADAEAATAHVFMSPGQYTVTGRVVPAVSGDPVDADPVVITVVAPGAFPNLDNDGGVCVPWITVDEVCAIIDGSNDEILMESAIKVATRWLHDATGMRWGGPCTSFIRPPDAACAVGRRHDPIDLSRWLAAPIRSIVEVRVDGVPIDPKWYYLSGDKLHASTGYDDADSPLIPWPTQNDDRQPGAADTWDLTVVHGMAPPEPLREAAKRLAAEIVKQCCGADDCALPPNAASVSRDGVTISFQPPTPFATGIRFVDAQIAQYGPNGYGRPARRMYDPAAPSDAQVGRFS